MCRFHTVYIYIYIVYIYIYIYIHTLFFSGIPFRFHDSCKDEMIGNWASGSKLQAEGDTKDSGQVVECNTKYPGDFTPTFPTLLGLFCEIMKSISIKFTSHLSKLMIGYPTFRF